MCRTPVVAAVDYAIASPLKGEGCSAPECIGMRDTIHF